MINDFNFGNIVINNKKYDMDVIIFPDNVYFPWWRKEGHKVYPEDLKKFEEYNPEVVIFGIGTSKRVEVVDSVLELLKNRGIKVLIEPTGEACKKYNEYCRKNDTVACLHLTC